MLGARSSEPVMDNPRDLSKVDSHRELSSWVAMHGLSRLVANIETVVTWVYLCAPTNAEPANRLLASKDLLVVFFSLDDIEGEDYGRYYDACVAVLADDADQATDDPLVDAYAEVVAEIEDRGLDTDSYRRGRLDLIEEYRWRNRVRRKEKPREEEYLCRRRVTIYTRQWIDMWELLEGCCLSPEARKLAVVRDAVAKMVEWQLLQNDLVSLRRDCRLQEVNLVSILCEQHGMPLEIAKQDVAARRDRARHELDDALAYLRRETLARPSLPLRYLEILEQCLRGTVENYRQNLVRYELDETIR